MSTTGNTFFRIDVLYRVMQCLFVWFQRLSKQCEPQHKPTVDLALATMTAVATDINNMKRKHEDAVRVQVSIDFQAFLCSD